MITHILWYSPDDLMPLPTFLNEVIVICQRDDRLDVTTSVFDRYEGIWEKHSGSFIYPLDVLYWTPKTSFTRQLQEKL